MIDRISSPLLTHFYISIFGVKFSALIIMEKQYGINYIA